MNIKKIPLLVSFLVIIALLIGFTFIFYKGSSIGGCLEVKDYGFPLKLFESRCVLNSPKLLCAHNQPSCSLHFFPINILLEIIIWIATSLSLYFVYINVINKWQKT